jgi:hypothetical protein
MPFDIDCVIMPRSAALCRICCFVFSAPALTVIIPWLQAFRRLTFDLGIKRKQKNRDQMSRFPQLLLLVCDGASMLPHGATETPRQRSWGVRKPEIITG